jgi:hypothetical protein
VAPPLRHFWGIDSYYFGYVSRHTLGQHQLAFGERDPQRSHDQKGRVLQRPTGVGIDIN